ncbi:MAG: hypothetical protein AAF433_15195 [Bacteroidota bacterium]
MLFNSFKLPGLFFSACLLLSSSCVSQSVVEPAMPCEPTNISAVAFGEFIDQNATPQCFFAPALNDAALDYRLNRDGSTENLPLIPWSNLVLRLQFVGTDPLNSHFSLHLQNSILDSAEAFSSPPIPLTEQLILDRLLTPGTYPVIGRGINARGYDARMEFSNDRFGGYSYNSPTGTPDAGEIIIHSSALTTNEQGAATLELSLSFELLIRQYYDPNSSRQLRNGVINVSIPVADLMPA